MTPLISTIIAFLVLAGVGYVLFRLAATIEPDEPWVDWNNFGEDDE